MTTAEIARRVLNLHQGQVVYISCLLFDGPAMPVTDTGDGNYRVAVPDGRGGHPASIRLDQVTEILSEECRPWPAGDGYGDGTVGVAGPRQGRG